MMKDSEFQERIVQILYLINAAISSHRLYLSHNAGISGNLGRAHGELLDLMQVGEPIALFLAGGDIVVNRRRLKYVSPATEKFARILKSKGIESVTFLSGLQENEFHQFVRDLASADSSTIVSRDGIKLGKVSLRINESEVGGENENSDDTETSQNTSERFIQNTALTTDELAYELAEQYLKIHQEKKIDFRDVGQILTKFMSEMQRNISPIYLLGTVKSFHEYTYTHLINVAILSMSLVGQMGVSGKQLLEVGIAALLHDVGKSFIPDDILNKTEKLSQEERAVIETHSLKGGLLLMKLEGIPKIVILSAIEHHLKYDGTGYPFIKPGWKPNIVAQTISIADVFDALRSRRAYNEPKTLREIEVILRKEKGTTFNPILVDMFLKMINAKVLQPVEESQNSVVSMNSSEQGQPDLKATPPPRLSETPIEKTSDQVPDAGSHPKEDAIMDNNLGLEQLVDKYLAENRTDAAVSALFDLIVTYAKEKNFTKAEMLREKLYEVDPMALNEIISSAEIIEQEKQKGITQDHQEIWADLYRTLEKEEGNCLYYSMKEASYNIDQPLFIQGEDNSNLYFIKQGQVKILCRHRGQEVLLKEFNPGDILGVETFFYNSVCTTSASPLSRVKVNYLEKKKLKEWKEKFPSLESKLYNYCLRFEKSCDLLKKKGLDRRVQKRFRVEGKASLQILSSSGAYMGKPFRGVVFDISASGLACIVKLVKKEIAQLLLGRKMELKLVIAAKGASKTIGQVGTVVAVSAPPFDDYYLHLKFHQLLDTNLIREIAATQTADEN